MTKSKTTKKALFASALSLILCFAMLLGTTYAWFTDSVTSTGNIIQSGKLKVTMEWLKGESDPTANDAAWTDASTGAIFNSKLWEPGYTEVRHIKIENEGTLALKYKLNIVANGEVSDLADVIDVYYIDPATGAITDRTQLTEDKKIGTLTEVLAGLEVSGNGVLVPAGKEGEGYKSVETITIALKMQESAGNEYQEKAIGSDFAIQLLATQYTYEEDSFDNQYDKEALFPVATADELTTAISEGKSVVLANDIELTSGSAISVSSEDVEVTVDLAGNDLSFNGETGIGALAGEINIVSTSDTPAKITMEDGATIMAWGTEAVINIDNVNITTGSGIEERLQIADGGTINFADGKIIAGGNHAPIYVYGGGNSDTTFNMYDGEIVVSEGCVGIAANNSSSGRSVVNLYGGKIVVADNAIGVNAYKAKAVYISEDFVFELGATNSYALEINRYGTQPILTGNIPTAILED